MRLDWHRGNAVLGEAMNTGSSGGAGGLTREGLLTGAAGHVAGLPRGWGWGDTHRGLRCPLPLGRSVLLGLSSSHWGLSTLFAPMVPLPGANYRSVLSPSQILCFDFPICTTRTTCNRRFIISLI